MTKDEAIEAIRRSGLDEHVDLLAGLLRPSARVVVGDEATASHLGGLPMLPRGAEWPRWDRRASLEAQIARLEAQFRANPRATGLRDVVAKMREDLSAGPVALSFVGRLSLREIAVAAPLPGWPADGMLAFFYEPTQSAWGFDPMDRGHCRVVYTPPGAELFPLQAPDDLDPAAVFPAGRVGFRREWTLPNRIESEEDENTFWGDDAFKRLCERLMPGIAGDQPVHRCGGWPQEVQGPMPLECELVANGIYCGDPSGYEDPRRATLEKNADDWQLLLQVDTDDRLGWMWGDSGRLYFWARRQDIESCEFEGAWAVLQCY